MELTVKSISFSCPNIDTIYWFAINDRSFSSCGILKENSPEKKKWFEKMKNIIVCWLFWAKHRNHQHLHSACGSGVPRPPRSLWCKNDLMFTQSGVRPGTLLVPFLVPLRAHCWGRFRLDARVPSCDLSHTLGIVCEHVRVSSTCCSILDTEITLC